MANLRAVVNFALRRLIMGGGAAAGVMATATAIAMANLRAVVNFALRRLINKNPEIISQANVKIGETGEALTTIATGLANDGQFDDREWKKLVKEVKDIWK
jgi:hypothetical protein